MNLENSYDMLSEILESASTLSTEGSSRSFFVLMGHSHITSRCLREEKERLQAPNESLHTENANLAAHNEALYLRIESLEGLHSENRVVLIL